MDKPKTVMCVDLEGVKHEVAVSDLNWRPSAYGIVIRDAHILLCRQFGKFNLPGGGVELGETLEQGLVREVKEETGIEVALPMLVAADSHLFMPPFGGKPFQSVLLYYRCEAVGGELSADGFDEVERQYAELAEWVPLETIDDWEITSSKDFRPLIKQVLAGQAYVSK